MCSPSWFGINGCAWMYMLSISPIIVLGMALAAHAVAQAWRAAMRKATQHAKTRRPSRKTTG